MKSLTIQQALEQGYTKYGMAGRDWQMTMDIDDGVFEEVPEEQWDEIVLFDKEELLPRINADTIAEMLAERISENDAEESGRDDDSVYKTVKNIDYTEIAAKVNKELKQHRYWQLTDIKLIKK